MTSHRSPAFKLRIKRGTSGLGLFAEEAIPKRRYVVEYWGKILSFDEGQRIGGKYLFDTENKKVINGMSRKNIARYINHSCRPNCEPVIRGDHVFIHSIRPIKPGDELTYDYGKEYFDMFIKPYGCRCPKHRPTAKGRG